MNQKIKPLKKENALLKEEVQTIQSEFSFMDSIVENASTMLEKMVPQVLEIMNHLML